MTSNRWFLYGPFILVALVLGLWWGLWREGAKVMRAEMANFAAAQEQIGANVSHGPLRTKGFPFFLRGVFSDFRYTAPGDGFSFAADQVFVDALPYALNRLIFSSWGEQQLVIGSETFHVEESNLRTSIGEDAARGWIFKAESDEVRLRNQRSDAKIDLQQLLVNAAPTTIGDQAIEISAVVSKLQITSRDNPIEVDELRFFGVVGDHGEIEIRLFEIEVGEAAFSVRGELGLEMDRRLTGVLNGEINQPVVFAKWLGAAAGLSEDQSRALEGASALLAFNGNKVSIQFRAGRTIMAGIDIGPAPKF